MTADQIAFAGATVRRRQANDTNPGESDTERIEEARGALIEGIIRGIEDESLMGAARRRTIDESVLIGSGESRRPGSFFPVIPVLQQHRVGTLELLEYRGFPDLRWSHCRRGLYPAGCPTMQVACDNDALFSRGGGVGPRSRPGRHLIAGVLRNHQARRSMCRAISHIVFGGGTEARTPTTTKTGASECRSRWASNGARQRRGRGRHLRHRQAERAETEVALSR